MDSRRALASFRAWSSHRRRADAGVGLLHDRGRDWFCPVCDLNAGITNLDEILLKYKRKFQFMRPLLQEYIQTHVKNQSFDYSQFLLFKQSMF